MKSFKEMVFEALKPMPSKIEEAVNVKAIQKAVDDGKSMDVIMTMFANKKTTNTDEIRKVVKDYMWKKRMKKEEVEIEEAMDPVNKDALKKKFKDRKDQDIDNDGDVDSSDEYLHKRRKAVSKAIGEAIEQVDEAKRKGAPKIKGDWLKQERERNRAHDSAMGRTATGRKKPERAMTSTQRSLASMRREEVELEEARWEYKGDKTYMVGGNLSYDDKMEYKLSKANADILNKYMKQAKSDAERSKVWKMFWDSKETGDKAKGPDAAIAFAKKAIKEEVEQLDELSPQTMDRYSKKAKTSSDRARNSATAKIVRQGDKADYSKEKDTIRKREKGMKMADRGQVRAFRKQMGYDKKNESVNEAKESYTINHKTFSAAVQHAKAQVEKKGYSIEGDEWDRKVAMGPRKPGKGKTNRYTIDLMKDGKETRRKLQMQVYYDEGRYELNMYVS